MGGSGMGGTYTRGSCLRVVGVWPCYNVNEEASARGEGTWRCEHIVMCTRREWVGRTRRVLLFMSSVSGRVTT